MAQSVKINGVLFDSVGVKYKGNSTYKANQTKNLFHIELNTYKSQDYGGYTDIKLSNVANDPSFVREVLSYQILRQYMDAPLCNYANVYVNGNLIGLYTNAESVSKKFVKSRFGSNDNAFVKCNPPAGAGPGTNDYPNLNYLGTDSTMYYDSYEIKSDGGWDQLINLADTLNNYQNDVDKIIDINRTLWMHAFNNVLVNLDSYSGGFTQNYYLYRGNSGHFLPIVWDLNESFGRFAMTGSVNLRTTADKQNLTYLLHENDASHPLIKNLLSNATYRRMYAAHCKTILEENFANGSFLVTGDSLQSTIDVAVRADKNKFFTDANFTDNLRSDITGGGPGPGGGGTPGIGNLMTGRTTYLMSQSAFTDASPTITQIKSSISTPKLNDKIFITSSIANENNVLIGYRFNTGDAFVTKSMYDDGAHGDGAANDGVYGLDFTMNSNKMQYYIYAENNTVGLFNPCRAEHEFYEISSPKGLLINELMSSNQTTIKGLSDLYSDWVELYNASEESIELSNYYLSDNTDDPRKWQLPSDILKPAGYQLVWASGDDNLSEWDADFKLSKSGENLGLYLADGVENVEVDFIQFMALNSDNSYGRETDGAANWIVFETATPNDTNRIVSPNFIEEQMLSKIKIYPNPANEILNFDFGNLTQNICVEIYNSIGAKVKYAILASGQQKLNISNLKSGIYIISLTSVEGLLQKRKLIVE